MAMVATDMVSDSNHFDNWAGDYDESIARFLDKFPFIGGYELQAAVRELARPEPGMKIIDVGIGTALLSVDLAKAGCLIYGVDFSRKMLKKAALRIPDALLERVDVTKNHLGRFNEKRFDRVISSYFLHQLSPEQKVSFLLRAASDNLKDGGKIVIGDIGFATRDDHRRAREKWARQWDYDEYYWCGEEVVADLKKVGMDASYKQITECSGVLMYEI